MVFICLQCQHGSSCKHQGQQVITMLSDRLAQRVADIKAVERLSKTFLRPTWRFNLQGILG
jgi:hypothetical protein